MELRQLRYFLAAASYLNFTKAAEACNIVQSAMSQQITALEKELNVQLFERTNRGLRLTTAGEIMANEARRLLDQVEITREIIDQAKNHYESVLRIGCHGNLLRQRLPQALRAFRRAYPATRVVITSGLHQTLLSELREGRIDCMISLIRSDSGGLQLQTQVICEDALYAMLPDGHRLSGHETVTMQEISGDLMILFTGDGNKRMVERMIENGIPAKVYAYSSSQNCIEAMVAAGYGISVCVESAIRAHSGIAYRKVQEVERRAVCLSWLKENPEEEAIRALASVLVMTPTELTV